MQRAAPNDNARCSRAGRVLPTEERYTSWRGGTGKLSRCTSAVVRQKACAPRRVTPARKKLRRSDRQLRYGVLELPCLALLKSIFTVRTERDSVFMYSAGSFAGRTDWLDHVTSDGGVMEGRRGGKPLSQTQLALEACRHAVGDESLLAWLSLDHDKSVSRARPFARPGVIGNMVAGRFRWATVRRTAGGPVWPRTQKGRCAAVKKRRVCTYR